MTGDQARALHDTRDHIHAPIIFLPAEKPQWLPSAFGLNSKFPHMAPKALHRSAPTGLSGPVPSLGQGSIPWAFPCPQGDVLPQPSVRSKCPLRPQWGGWPLALPSTAWPPSFAHTRLSPGHCEFLQDGMVPTAMSSTGPVQGRHPSLNGDSCYLPSCLQGAGPLPVSPNALQ